MAQAARLSMRMQKELKILLSDPPHGVSFPLLSSSSAAGSDDLSTIHAHIEGPEDSVYANGIFTVKIQIPDRYPFQPPIVAFATPIYHPNIDNSGRICLDILNLPPKGAWQPSLNISTVLTSIGLLLSEPNPDDGLMCDVSREYKYNRQTFDYKAREMTEKYAKVNKADGSSVSLQVSPSTCENREINSHGDEKAYESGHQEKLKLNAESTLTHTENLETATKDMLNSQQKDGMKPNRKRLSLALPQQSQKKHLFAEELAYGVSSSCKVAKKPYSVGNKLSLSVKQPMDNVASLDNNSASSRFHTKSDNNTISRKLSLRQHGEEVSKTNMNQNQDARTRHGEFENRDTEDDASVSESIVVLDSDDSGKEEEERVSLRSRLSLSRRGFKSSRP
ncbi:unnamed protein product [Cochlearia groenlandica]